MFRSDFLETFTKVHPIVPALLYVPVVLWAASRGFRMSGASALVGGLGLGGALWTLAEYVLHRFLFHIEPRGPVSRLIYFNLHGVHHEYPDDELRLVMVPAVSLPLAWLFFELFSAVLPGGLGQSAYGGFVAGYLVYDYSHWAVHHARAARVTWLGPWAAILASQRKRHLKHHFGDSSRGYGVSTGLWDHVFRTVDRSI